LEEEADGPEMDMEFRAASPVNLDIRWRDVPNVLVDQTVGFAAAGGVVRLTFGSLVFTPGGDLPHVRPEITLAMSHDALEGITTSLNNLVAQFRESVDGTTDEGGPDEQA